MKVRYSRLWGIGNFENEKVELEREFRDEKISFPAALNGLMAEVEVDHERRVKLRDAEKKIRAAEEEIAYLHDNRVYLSQRDIDVDVKLEEAKSRLRKAKAELRKLFTK
jgi:hypothetical protein